MGLGFGYSGPAASVDTPTFGCEMQKDGRQNYRYHGLYKGNVCSVDDFSKGSEFQYYGIWLAAPHTKPHPMFMAAPYYPFQPDS